MRPFGDHEGGNLNFNLDGCRLLFLLGWRFHQSQVFVQIARTAAHGNLTVNLNGSVFIDAKKLCDVFAIEIEIGQ